MFNFTGVIKRKSLHLYFFLLFAVIFLVGIGLGSVFASFVKGLSVKEFAENVNYSMAHSGGNIREAVLSSAFSVYTLVLLLWCCGFCKKWLCIVIAAVVVTFKGVVTGYTTAMLIKAFGMHGVGIATVSILPQYIILLPLVFFEATAAVIFSQMHFTKVKLKKYTVLLPVFLITGFICALADGFGAGKLMALFF